MGIIHSFYELGAEYTHMAHPWDTYKLIEFNATHAIFKRTHGWYLVPFTEQHIFMLRKAKLGTCPEIEIKIN